MYPITAGRCLYIRVHLVSTEDILPSFVKSKDSDLRIRIFLVLQNCPQNL